jgi:DNA-directed RNA polymerase III subunit RPC11
MILCEPSSKGCSGTLLNRLVCPVCSNRLQVTKVSAGEGNPDSNRFECRTCPYQHIIKDDWEWFERKKFPRKEVEDVIGGPEAWANADKMEGMPSLPSIDGLGLTVSTAQCPNPKCHNREAYFYQLQIRSADEPMTTFLKVFRPA